MAGADGELNVWKPHKAAWIKPEGLSEPSPPSLLRGNLRSSASRVGGIARLARMA